MKIVSLLPSATELICGLGLLEQLVGVSHECDYPASVKELPVLTRSRIPPGLPSNEIDRLVTEQLETDIALYNLELDTLIALAPDLIVTQALCDVCAVSGSEVARALASLPGDPQVVNLEPTCLGDVLDTVTLVAEAAGCPERGRRYVAELEQRIDRVAGRSAAIAEAQKPRVAMLDWLDPLFDGGHWCPEIIELAGGVPCLGEKQTPSRRRQWSELIDAQAEVIFIALCGFDIKRSLTDVHDFFASEGFAQLWRQCQPKIYLVDGNAYFSRPGPRLVDSLEIMANALHPQKHPLPADLEAAMTFDRGTIESIKADNGRSGDTK
ncbi:MAG: cobalamin-binding protein [Porticoccaceae bacterium]|nr:cobalamin-binding protein [Porticoccaceae bacterium]